MKPENINQRGEAEERLQNLFEGHSLPADDYVWQNISEALKERPKRAMAWWTWAAAACLGWAVAGYLLLTRPDTSTQVAENRGSLKSENTAKSHQPLLQPGEPKALAEAVNSPVEKADAHTASIHGTGIGWHGRKEATAISKEKETVPAAPQLAMQSMPLLPCAVTGRTRHEAPKMRLSEYAGVIEMPTNEQDAEQDGDPMRWALAANVLLSGGGASSSSTLPKASQNYTESTALADMNIAEEQNYDINYQPPVITGVTTILQLSKRWALESGLAYSLLSSSAEGSENAGEKTYRKTHLHYLGVPMGVNYSFLLRKKLSLYCSAGLQFDKGLAYREITTHTTNGEVTGESTQSGSLGGFQAGMYSGIGADWKIGRFISLHIQPGISYWPVQVNQPANVRHYHRLWPGLRTGMRFHF